MMVELFYRDLVLHDSNGKEWPSIEGVRDFRRELGFYDGMEWCELNTGHDVFEMWRTEGQKPTHWRQLPPPPTE